MDTVTLVFLAIAFIEAQLALIFSIYVMVKHTPPRMVETPEEEETVLTPTEKKDYDQLRKEFEELSQ